MYTLFNIICTTKRKPRFDPPPKLRCLFFHLGRAFRSFPCCLEKTLHTNSEKYSSDGRPIKLEQAGVTFLLSRFHRCEVSSTKLKIYMFAYRKNELCKSVMFLKKKPFRRLIPFSFSFFVLFYSQNSQVMTRKNEYY